MTYCIIKRNYPQETLFYLLSNSQITIFQCIITETKANAIFLIRNTSSLIAYSCYIDSSAPIYRETQFDYVIPEVHTVDSLSLQNDNIFTAECHAVHPISYLKNVVLEKELFEKGKDKFVTGTVFLDERRIEPLKLITQIDNFPIKSEYKSDLNSQYNFSISIPDELENGTHTISVRYIDDGIEESNIVHVKFDFLIIFSLELDQLSKTNYNKTIDGIIPVSGRIYTRQEFSLHCSIDDTEVNMKHDLKNINSDTYYFDGNCSIKDFPKEEGQYLLKIWVSTTDGIKIQSKQFMFYRNHHNLDVTTKPKEIYKYIIDENIVISGTVSDLDCDEVINVTASIDNLTSKSSIINIEDKYDHSFNLNLDIPENLKSEFHTVNLTSCEKNNYCLNKTYVFKYLYNEPILSILETPNFPIYINKQKFINLVLSIQDIDGNGDIIIYHKINNSEKYNLLNKLL